MKEQQQQKKIRDWNSWFLEKINKFGKPFSQLNQKNQIHKTRDWKTNITIDIEEIHKDKLQNVYFTKLNDIKEMDTFLDIYALQRLNQDAAI